MKIYNCDCLKDLPLKIVRVEGNARERGRQYGQKAKDIIEKSLEINKNIFFRLMNVDSVESIYKRVHMFCSALKRYDYDIYEEMVGISEGAKIKLDDILFLNFRPELINPFSDRKNFGCTTVKLEKDECFVGQTFDWFKGTETTIMGLIEKQEDGTEYFMIVEAGTISGIGINNRGIVNLLNYLGNIYFREDGAGYNVLLKRIIKSDCLETAQREVLRSPVALGLNVLMADVEQNCYDYEITSRGIDFKKITERKYIHTNHFKSSKLQAKIFSQSLLLESRERLTRANEILSYEDNIFSNIDKCFCYHTEEENGSICRHGKNYNDIETLFSMVINLNKQILFLKIGPSCMNAYYQIQFVDVFKE